MIEPSTLREWLHDYAELFLAPLVATLLVILGHSSLPGTFAAVAFGVLLWTLMEYLIHRFVLHGIWGQQHALHHRDQQMKDASAFWMIWIAVAFVGASVSGLVAAGALYAYTWFLLVHHASHHRPDLLPNDLLEAHLWHHKIARFNFGVSTRMWDRVFGTELK